MFNLSRLISDLDNLLPPKMIVNTPIPSGIECLDSITNGGLERGYITELWGDSVSGKTALAYQYSNQTAGALWIDSNNSFDYPKAIKFGLDTDNVVLTKLTGSDYIVQMIAIAARIKSTHLAIIDDLAAVNFEHPNQPKHIRDFKQSIQSVISNSSLAVLILNQHRYSPGVGASAYGSRSSHIETASLKMTRIRSLSKGHKRIGSEVSVEPVFSRSYVAKGMATFNIQFDGIVEHD